MHDACALEGRSHIQNCKAQPLQEGLQNVALLLSYTEVFMAGTAAAASHSPASDCKVGCTHGHPA